MLSRSIRGAIGTSLLGSVFLNLQLLDVRAGDAPPISKTADVDPQAVWSTPGDGRLVMLARSATASFDKPTGVPIPFRIRVCVTNFTGVKNAVTLYVWTKPNPWDIQAAIPQLQTRQLSLGDCVEFDRVTAIIAQDSTITGTSSGYYQLFEQTHLPGVGKSANPPPLADGTTNGPKKLGHEINYGKVENGDAPCLKIGQTNDNYYKDCHLKLPAVQHDGIRICTGTKYITSDDGKDQYPPGYLELLINKDFLPPKNKPSDYDYNWNPITPNSHVYPLSSGVIVSH